MDFTTIAEHVLGPVEWTAHDQGYCRCPGIDLHTNRNGTRDCRVMLNGAPTIHCVHSSCTGAVAEANHRLRSEVGKAERGAGGILKPRAPSAEDIARRRRTEQARKLAERSRKSLARVVAEHRIEIAELFESSPVRLVDDPKNEWRLLLELFPRDGAIWIGDTKDSCDDTADAGRKAFCRRHFRTVEEWLVEEKAPGQFTCPSSFRPGVHSRSATNVVSRPFLVVESDTMGKAEVLGVFTWMRKFMCLRAVVDTGGKSLHGWFDFPDDEALGELKVILPALQCDAALFNASQPCRLPGAERGDKLQTLLWLDLGKA
jgi:hypothetical protein